MIGLNPQSRHRRIERAQTAALTALLVFFSVATVRGQEAPDDGYASIIRALDSKDASSRLDAARKAKSLLAARSPDETTRPVLRDALLRTLADPQARVRHEAAAALGRLPDETTARALTEAFVAGRVPGRALSEASNRAEKVYAPVVLEAAKALASGARASPPRTGVTATVLRIAMKLDPEAAGPAAADAFFAGGRAHREANEVLMARAGPTALSRVFERYVHERQRRDPPLLEPAILALLSAHRVTAAPMLSRALNNTDPARAAAAVRVLATLGDKSSSRAVCAAVSSKVPEVRREAIRSAGERRVHAAAGALDARINAALIAGDKDEAVRAARALSEVARNTDVARLSRLRNSAEPGVRREMIRALARLDYAKAQPGLKRALEDPDEENRRLAALSMGDHNDASAATVLRDIARAEDRGDAIRATLALARMGDRELAEWFASNLGTEAIAPRADTLSRKNRALGVSAARAGALAMLGEKARVLNILRAKKGTSPVARRNALLTAMALGAREPVVAETVVRLLKTDAPAGVAAARVVAQRLRLPGAFEALVARALDSDDPLPWMEAMADTMPATPRAVEQVMEVVAKALPGLFASRNAQRRVRAWNACRDALEAAVLMNPKGVALLNPFDNAAQPAVRRMNALLRSRFPTQAGRNRRSLETLTRESAREKPDAVTRRLAFSALALQGAPEQHRAMIARLENSEERLAILNALRAAPPVRGRWADVLGYTAAAFPPDVRGAACLLARHWGVSLGRKDRAALVFRAEDPISLRLTAAEAFPQPAPDDREQRFLAETAAGIAPDEKKGPVSRNDRVLALHLLVRLGGEPRALVRDALLGDTARAEEFAKAFGERAVHLLGQALGSPGLLGQQAVRMLVVMDQQATVDAVLARLDHGESRGRMLALLGVMAIAGGEKLLAGGRAKPVLLLSEDQITRVLSRLSPRGALSERLLIERLARALAPEDGAPRLAPLLADPHAGVRARAAGALGELGGKTAMALLRGRYPLEDVAGVKAEILKGLLLGRDAKAADLALDDVGNRQTVVAGAAAYVAGSLGAPTRAIKLLESPQEPVRRGAMIALGLSGLQKTRGPLLERFRESAAAERRAAAIALGLLGLYPALAKTPDDSPFQFYVPEIEVEIRAALRSADMWTRSFAVRALARSRSEGALADLRAVAARAHAPVVLYALAETLLGVTPVRGELAGRHPRDTVTDVELLVARAGQGGGNEAATLLCILRRAPRNARGALATVLLTGGDKVEQLRPALVEALVPPGTPAAESRGHRDLLLWQLASPRMEVQAAAIRALGRCADKEVGRVLVGLLRSAETDVLGRRLPASEARRALSELLGRDLGAGPKAWEDALGKQ